MSAAPDWLTHPNDNAALLYYAVPLIVIGSVATNKYFDASTNEGKGKVLIASGVSVMIMLGLLSSLCAGSKKGICAFVPEEIR
jgi:hypothetical protein